MLFLIAWTNLITLSRKLQIVHIISNIRSIKRILQRYKTVRTVTPGDSTVAKVRNGDAEESRVVGVAAAEGGAVVDRGHLAAIQVVEVTVFDVAAHVDVAVDTVGRGGARGAAGSLGPVVGVIVGSWRVAAVGCWNFGLVKVMHGIEEEKGVVHGCAVKVTG